MNLREALEAIPGTTCRWDTDLTMASTFRLESRGDFLEVSTEDALASVIVTLNQHGRSYRLLGWGANQVLASRETDLMLKLAFPVDESRFASPRDEYELPASTGLNQLTAHALRYGLKGWEALTGIPASLGGAIYMNAGTALGEIAAVTRRVRVMGRDGLVRTEEIHPGSFSYRRNHFVGPGEVIVGATLFHHGLDAQIPEKIKAYQDYRRGSQPLATKNCGCVFKNSSPARQAGRLIDLTGLKGLGEGGLRVSPRHANFIENMGGGTSEDFHRLVARINHQMRLHWGVEFELEVKAL